MKSMDGHDFWIKVRDNVEKSIRNNMLKQNNYLKEYL